MNRRGTFRNAIKNVLIIVILCAFFVALFSLHSRQLNPDFWSKGIYSSDFPAHMGAFTSGKTYSWLRYLLPFVQKSFGNNGVAFVIACAEILTVFAVALLLCQTMNKVKSYSTALILGVACLIEKSFWYPNVKYLYFGCAVTTVLHNTTYIFMLLAETLAILFFFKMVEDGISVIKWKYWVAYTLFLTLATGIKGSFLTCFAPVLLVLLIVDFIRTRCRNITNEVLIGISVFPSLLILYLQTLQLFDDTSRVIFKPFALWQDYFLSSQLRSIPFVLCVMVMFFKKYKGKLWYIFSLLMGFCGYAEFLLLAESGPRMMHGNMGWSWFSGYFVLFSASVSIFANEWSLFLREDHKNRKKLVCLVFCSLLLCWHVFSGVVYLRRLLNGSYYC